MERWKGQVAVVAGATGGVGSETVKRLLNDGIVVVGIARCKDALAKISNSENFHVLQADITVEQEVLNAFKWIKENCGPIHILVNCIGTIWFGNFIDSSLEVIRKMYETDVFGFSLLVKEATANMRENGIDGHFVNVSGLTGHGVYLPNGSLVASGKSALTSAVDSIRRELIAIGSKIKISNISPGFVRTKLFYQNIAQQPEFREYADYCSSYKEALNSSDVVDSIIYVLSTPPHVQVHNIQLRAVGSAY